MKVTKRRPSRLIVLTGHRGVGKSTIANHLVATKGYARVSFSSHVYADISHMFGGLALEGIPKSEPSGSLAIFHVENAKYREYLHSRGEDLYEPRSIHYHLDNYGVRYAERIDPLRWIILATSRIMALEGQDIVVPSLRTHRDLREYHAIQRVTTLSGRGLMILSVQMAGHSGFGHEADGMLPAYAVDGSIDNIYGMLPTTLALVDHEIAAWFGD